jgi:hypothetical protein
VTITKVGKKRSLSSRMIPSSKVSHDL